MVPISELLSHPNSRLKLAMSGGTAFTNVKITDADIQRREGTLQTLKRAFGFKVIPKIEILVKPALHMIPAITNGALLSPATTAAIEANRCRLYHVLPPNIILPTKGFVVVAIYRLMLQKALRLTIDAPDRVLPQSACCIPNVDPILSSLPKLLADAAACRVLLYLWSKEAPTTVTAKPIAEITVEDVAATRVSDVYRDVVLRMYRGFNHLDAQPDRLNPFETIETVYKREAAIRNYVGVHSDILGVVPPAATSGPGASGGAAKPAADPGPGSSLHVPFNARELMWSGR